MEQRKFNGDRLKKARIYNGISLTDLATQADIKKQSISLYENGKNVPDHEKVRVLARVLGFPYDYFFQKDKIKAYTERILNWKSIMKKLLKRLIHLKEKE